MPKKDWMVKLNDLDDDQKLVFYAILDKSCIVSGCAGSGKSVLALIKAQRIQKELGNNYQIIVYTKALCGYMESGRETLGLNRDFDYHWRWKNRKGMPKADYTIVDEIQDFTKEEIGEFIEATNKHFFFFGDTAQSIYKPFKDTLPVEEILYAFPDKRSSTKKFELYRNYRLPLQVARMAQCVGEELPPFIESIYQSKETQKPFLIKYSNNNEQISSIGKIIKNRGLTDVGIFMPDNDTVEMLVKMFQEENIDIEYRYSIDGTSYDTLDFDTDLPKVMTYHSAKGLQFETVFLPLLPSTIEDNDRSALYVAMTRTYHFLYMMYSDSKPNLLANAPQDCYETSTETIIMDK